MKLLKLVLIVKQMSEFSWFPILGNNQYQYAKFWHFKSANTLLGYFNYVSKIQFVFKIKFSTRIFRVLFIDNSKIFVFNKSLINTLSQKIGLRFGCDAKIGRRKQNQVRLPAVCFLGHVRSCFTSVCGSTSVHSQGLSTL